MFTISVETHFRASHRLILPDGSTEPLHEHDWRITANVAGEQLNKEAVVMDFQHLKGMVDNITVELCDTGLQKKDYFQKNNPSAEMVAKYIYGELADKLPKISRSSS